MKKTAPFLVIGVICFIVGILASPYIMKATDTTKPKMIENETAVTDKQPQNKVEAFEKCAVDDMAGKLKIITMPESERKEGDPIWWGGCNGNWLQPVCEAGINQMSPMFEESLTSCMYKHLF